MRLLCLLLAFSILTGCGGSTSIGFISNPGSATSTGTVSIIRLSFVSNSDGTTATITVVTLINVGSSSTINFCGDQRTQFTLNQFVTATYTTGSTCSTLVSVRGS